LSKLDFQPKLGVGALVGAGAFIAVGIRICSLAASLGQTNPGCWALMIEGLAILGLRWLPGMLSLRSMNPRRLVPQQG
jgi:hypothetical protein